MKHEHHFISRLIEYNVTPLYSISTMHSFLMRTTLLISFLAGFTLTSCKKVKEQHDQLYSRHLQRQVKLTVINTPISDKAEMNLIIFNDGQLLDELGAKDILTKLYEDKKLLPVVVVGIDAANRQQEFGISTNVKNNSTGSKADHYAEFVNNELYPYIKKKAGVRKFNTIAIAGFGAGALSAFDIAWLHADRISKVGMFSGAFSRKNNASDTTSAGDLYDMIKTSRKRPKTTFWFYAGANGNTGLPNDDAVNIESSTNSIIQLLDDKSFITNGDIAYKKGAGNNVMAWKAVLPDFFEWTVGK